MKYGFFPKAMWKLFKKNYKKQLKLVLEEPSAGYVMSKAKIKYREIVETINEFDKGERFLFNILSCAMLSAIILNLSREYNVNQITMFYCNAMNNKIMRKAAKKSNVYTSQGRALLKNQAKNSELQSNPYSWVFEVEDGANLNEYTATFKSCGICYLMNQLGIGQYIPAMCAFDYEMAKMNNTEFARTYTLAAGGPYCDCHYKHNGKLRK